MRTSFKKPRKKIRRCLIRVKQTCVVSCFLPIINKLTSNLTNGEKLGRGFTQAELKAAGIRCEIATSIGLALDHRRKNRNLVSLRRNTIRLISFTNRLFKSMSNFTRYNEAGLKTRYKENVNKITGRNLRGKKKQHIHKYHNNEKLAALKKTEKKAARLY